MFWSGRPGVRDSRVTRPCAARQTYHPRQHTECDEVRQLTVNPVALEEDRVASRNRATVVPKGREKSAHEAETDKRRKREPQPSHRGDVTDRECEGQDARRERLAASTKHSARRA
jgi:hypothetical protein